MAKQRCGLIKNEKHPSVWVCGLYIKKKLHIVAIASVNP